jgi:hypothetical protein
MTIIAPKSKTVHVVASFGLLPTATRALIKDVKQSCSKFIEDVKTEIESRKQIVYWIENYETTSR